MPWSRSFSVIPQEWLPRNREHWHQMDSEASSSSGILFWNYLLQQTWKISLHLPPTPNIIPLFPRKRQWWAVPLMLLDTMAWGTYLSRHSEEQAGEPSLTPWGGGRRKSTCPHGTLSTCPLYPVGTQPVKPWQSGESGWGRMVDLGLLPCQRIKCCH